MALAAASLLFSPILRRTPRPLSTIVIEVTNISSQSAPHPAPTCFKIVDSYLHVWASHQEAVERYPYSRGQESTIPGDIELLLKCMIEADIDGALIVQPINHMFDHSLVTRYPSKFINCCLANPAEDGSGINQIEHLIIKDGYRAVRYNSYLWPSGQKVFQILEPFTLPLLYGYLTTTSLTLT